MREVFIFAAGASVVGTIFLVSLIELFFTRKRRKIREELDLKVKEMKASYNESINKMVLEEEEKLEEADKQVETMTKQMTTEKTHAEEEFKEKIDEVKSHSDKAIAKAKARAKELEHEAHQKAEEYLESRKKEVEQELMNLVLSVTKKVLPAGLTYETHKELVMEALKDVRATNQEK
jgi:flagellar biosynthesis/type III secretory pathway protein FliH